MLDLTTGKRALGFAGLASHNAQVANLGDWVSSTEGDLANILHMPDKAQREVSFRGRYGGLATVTSEQRSSCSGRSPFAAL